jgi:hypothetical protein
LIGEGSDLFGLGLVEVVHGINIATRGLHLDGDPAAPDSDHEIYLSAADTDIAVDDDRTVVDEKPGGDTLTEGPQSSAMIVLYRAELGSSSSMLMSRNVITLTLLTNRAGRYMSHTHASFNSSSK